MRFGPRGYVDGSLYPVTRGRDGKMEPVQYLGHLFALELVLDALTQQSVAGCVPHVHDPVLLDGTHG